jgi:hypothetical protein
MFAKYSVSDKIVIWLNLASQNSIGILKGGVTAIAAAKFPIL